MSANQSATEPMFGKQEILKHLKSGGVYTVVGLPTEYVLEHNHKPAYAYRMPDGRICVREQEEMEDGRFVSLGFVEVVTAPNPRSTHLTPTEYVL